MHCILIILLSCAGALFAAELDHLGPADQGGRRAAAAGDHEAQDRGHADGMMASICTRDGSLFMGVGEGSFMGLFFVAIFQWRERLLCDTEEFCKSAKTFKVFCKKS